MHVNNNPNKNKEKLDKFYKDAKRLNNKRGETTPSYCKHMGYIKNNKNVRFP